MATFDGHTRTQSERVVGSEPKRQTNLLKFVKEAAKIRGIKCYPEQTYGVSRESPNQFRSKNTLSPSKGGKKQFEYYSQKHFIDLCNDPQQNPQFQQKYKKSFIQNKNCFHRRKGRLSDFMDHNGWMSKEFKIMGDQRNQTARSFKNKDRDQWIHRAQSQLSQKQKTVSFMNTLKTTNTSFKPKFSTSLISQKSKIRQFRNQMATICTERPNTTDNSNQNKSASFNGRETWSSLQLPGSKKTLFEFNNPSPFKDQKTWKEGNEKIQKWKAKRCCAKFSNPQFINPKVQKLF